MNYEPINRNNQGGSRYQPIGSPEIEAIKQDRANRIAISQAGVDRLREMGRFTSPLSRREATGRAAAFSTAPTLGAVGGGAAGAKLGAGIGAIAGPVGAAAGGIIGAIGGAIGGAFVTNRAQEEVLKIVESEEWLQHQQELLQRGREEFPGATFGAEVAPSLLTLRASPETVSRAVNFAQRVLTNPRQASQFIRTPQGAAGLDDLLNVSLGGAVDAGGELYNQAQEGDINALRLISAGLVGSVINQPTRFGMRLGVTPSGVEMTPDPSVRAGGTAEAPSPDTIAPDAPRVVEEEAVVTPQETAVSEETVTRGGEEAAVETTQTPETEITAEAIEETLPTVPRETDVLPPRVEEEGGTSVSRLQARMEGYLGRTERESMRLAEEMNIDPVTYRRLTDAENSRNAARFVEESTPQEIINVIEGRTPAPDRTTSSAVYLAAQEKLKLTGDADFALRVASAEATRHGQEISFLRNADPDNPVSKMVEIQQARTKSLARTLRGSRNQTPEQVVAKEVNRNVSEGVKELTAAEIKIAEAERFLDEILC